MKENLAYTFGALDGISIDDHIISASGWVVGLETKVDDIIIDCDAQPLPTHKVLFRGASPDVQQAHPDIPDAGECRFQLTAPLPYKRGEVNDGRLVAAIPRIGDRRGIPLERILPLRLPVPRPEQSLMVGHGDFVETSFAMLALLRLVAHLPRNARVLEPGCGLGRIAFALLHYLNGSGRYEGFDVSHEAIQLAQSMFAGTGNALFRHVDLYNRMYNQAGKLRAEDFSFPYPAANFDFVILTSVFTHMLPNDVRRYLVEIARTLSPGGTCFATFFALDAVARENLRTGKAALNIVTPYAHGCFVLSASVPENAVAYDHSMLCEMIAQAGLTIEKTYWGKWSGRRPFLSYQDTFLLRKP